MQALQGRRWRRFVWWRAAAWRPALGWCRHGSLHGNRAHGHAGVARSLIAAGAIPGDGTRETSPAVLSVL